MQPGQPPSNTGGFMGGTSGMSPELIAAIHGRNTVGGPTAQVGVGAPNPMAQNQPPTPLPPGAAQPNPSMGGMAPDPTQGAPTQDPNAVPPQFPFDPQETAMIVGALGNRLKAISEMGKASLGVHPAQQPPTQGGM